MQEGRRELGVLIDRVLHLGAPMARAASLSATMMRAPTGVRAGISATLRAPGISAALGARGVDLNLDLFSFSRAKKVSSEDNGDYPIGNAFWSALETTFGSPIKDENKNLLNAIFNPRLSDRRNEGDRFVPPDMSVSNVKKLGSLLKEEEKVRKSRKGHFFSNKFVMDDAGPLFPSCWKSSVKIAHGQTSKQFVLYKAEEGEFNHVMESVAPVFKNSTEDGTIFRIYKKNRFEIRTTQENDSEEKVGAVFSMKW